MENNFNFEKNVIEFIAKKEVSGYLSCMNSFKSYLITQHITDNNRIKTYFQGLRSDTLIESLKYYIDSNHVTSFGAANKYVACIKEYFLNIVQDGELNNAELLKEFAFKTYDEQSYRYKANIFLSKNDSILTEEKFEIFDNVKNLIINCDETMSDDNVLLQIPTSQKYFNKYRSALIIKLILLTGITYRALIKIKKMDLDCKSNSNTIYMNITYIFKKPLVSLQRQGLKGCVSGTGQRPNVLL